MHEPEIRAWVEARREELDGFLRELVRGGAPSVCGTSAQPAVDAALASAVGTAESLGFTVEVRERSAASLAGHAGFLAPPDPDAPVRYLVAKKAGRGDGPSLLLNGHIDVVTAGDPSAWTHPPFDGVADTGRMFGRGTSDAKGPFAAALFGAACAAEIAGPLCGDLTVVAATDEEVGGMSTLASLVDGHVADAVLVGEPTELAVAPAGRGIMDFRLTVEGRHAHSGAGFEGVSAVVKIATLVLAIAELETTLDERFPNELYAGFPVAHCINIGAIRGGGALNAVPSEAAVEVRVPLVGDDDPAEIRRAIEEGVRRAAESDAWFVAHPPQLEWLPFSLPAAFTAPAHPFVATAVEAVAAVSSREPAVVPLLGASDLRFYSHFFGIPGLHYGPGAMRLGHGDDELVPLDDLYAATAGVAAIALQWCKCPCALCATAETASSHAGRAAS